MTRDPLLLRAIELLARGHSLYGPEYFDAGLSDAPGQLRQRAVRICQGDGAGMGAAAAHVRTAAGLRRIAAADSELAAALADAGSDHAAGRQNHDRSSMRRLVTSCRRQIRRSGNGKPCVAWPLACTGNGVTYIGRIGVRSGSPGG